MGSFETFLEKGSTEGCGNLGPQSSDTDPTIGGRLRVQSSPYGIRDDEPSEVETANPLGDRRVDGGLLARRRASRKGFGRPELEAVRTEDYLYVEYETAERELYDLKKDPYQLDNRCEGVGSGLARLLTRRCRPEKPGSTSWGLATHRRLYTRQGCIRGDAG